MCEEEKKELELVDRAMFLIKRDIEINKKLAKINFSSFLGEVVNILSNFIFQVSLEVKHDLYHTKGMFEFPVIKNEKMRNLFVLLMFGVVETAKRLKIELGNKVYFLNTSKAIVAIGSILCCDCEKELGRIEKFVEELMAIDEDHELNHKASLIFMKFLKWK